MKVLILEDEKESLNVLRKILGECAPGIIPLPADSLEEAVKYLEKEEKIDLFLLDVNLDPANPEDQAGFFFAERIRRQSRYEFTPIVMITSLAGLEMESYRRLHCYQYLLKPFHTSDVKLIVKKVFEHTKDRERDSIIVKKDGINYRLFCDDIVYIQAVPRGVCIFLKKGKIEVKYLSIRRLEEMLSKEKFVRCHRMFLINREQTEYYDLVNQFVKMRGYEDLVDIGTTYRQEIRRGLDG